MGHHQDFVIQSKVGLRAGAYPSMQYRRVGFRLGAIILFHKQLRCRQLNGQLVSMFPGLGNSNLKVVSIGMGVEAEMEYWGDGSWW